MYKRQPKYLESSSVNVTSRTAVMKNDVVQSGVTDAAQNRQLHKGLNKEIIKVNCVVFVGHSPHNIQYKFLKVDFGDEMLLPFIVRVLVCRAGNGSLTVTHDSLTHSNSDP